MTITEIAARGNERYLVRFDDGSEIKMTADGVAKYALYTGKEMDGEAYAALTGAASLASAKRRALRIVGARAHSRAELTRKLREKGESAEDAEAAADWLCELGYIDDAEFAGMIVRHYAAKGYGRARIRNELYCRGVAREHWDDAFLEMPESGERVYSLLRARLGGEDPSGPELKRATDALMRRGFSWDEISGAVRRYREELKEEE